eukprot:425406-Rhodomonas_salina.1
MSRVGSGQVKTELLDYAAMAAKYHKLAQQANADVKNAFSGTPRLSFQKATSDLDAARSGLNSEDNGGLNKLTNSLKAYAQSLKNVGGAAPRRVSAPVHYATRNVGRIPAYPALGQEAAPEFEGGRYGELKNDVGVQLHIDGRRRAPERSREVRRPTVFPAFAGREIKSEPFNIMGNLQFAMQAL